MTPIPNPQTFDINQKRLAGAVAVSDDEVRNAMLFAHEHFKLVIEPAGAVGIAAVLSGKVEIRGKAIATIATGGNIDADRFCQVLRAALSHLGDYA